MLLYVAEAMVNIMYISSGFFNFKSKYNADKISYGKINGNDLVVLETVERPGIVLPGLYNVIGTERQAIAEDKNYGIRYEQFISDCNHIIVKDVLPFKYMYFDAYKSGDITTENLTGEQLYVDKIANKLYVQRRQDLLGFQDRDVEPEDMFFGLVTPLYNHDREGLQFGPFNSSGVGVKPGYDLRALEKTKYEGIYRNRIGLFVVDASLVDEGYGGLVTEMVSRIVPAKKFDSFVKGRSVPFSWFLAKEQDENFEQRFCESFVDAFGKNGLVGVQRTFGKSFPVISVEK